MLVQANFQRTVNKNFSAPSKSLRFPKKFFINSSNFKLLSMRFFQNLYFYFTLNYEITKFHSVSYFCTIKAFGKYLSPIGVEVLFTTFPL